MRILQLISTTGYYGAESMVFNLSRELHERGTSISLCSLTARKQRSTALVEKASDTGIAVQEICCSGRFEWRVVRDLRRLLREQNISVIHAHNYKANFYALLASRGLGIRLVATCHNWTNSTRSLRLYAALDRLMLRRFDRIIAVSEPIASALLKAGIPPDRLSRIDNGIDVEQFAAAEREPAEVTVGTVCRLVPEKGVAVLLQAVRETFLKFPKTRLLVAGEGPSRAVLEQLAQKLGIAPRVSFLGFCHDMPAFYTGLDIFVLPSWREGMPMSVLEAMASGKPVIATNVGEVSRLVTDATGFLIAPGDHSALVQAMNALIQNPELRRSLGERAAKRASTMYSRSLMTDRYLQLYQEICAFRAASSPAQAQAQAAVSE